MSIAAEDPAAAVEVDEHRRRVARWTVDADRDRPAGARQFPVLEWDRVERAEEGGGAAAHRAARLIDRLLAVTGRASFVSSPRNAAACGSRGTPGTSFLVVRPVGVEPHDRRRRRPPAADGACTCDVRGRGHHSAAARSPQGCALPDHRLRLPENRLLRSSHTRSGLSSGSGARARGRARPQSGRPSRRASGRRGSHGRLVPDASPPRAPGV